MTGRSKPETKTSKDEILRVAVEEFAKRGFAATRVDEIARRADINKQLIYYYFGSKVGLYDAVLESMVDRSTPAWATLAESDFKGLLSAYFSGKGHRTGAKWRRLLIWEGIEYGAHPHQTIRLEQLRANAYDVQTKIVAREIEKGSLPQGVDPKILSLMMTIASIGPELLPQVTKMITGREANDPGLREEMYATFLAMLDTMAKARPVAEPETTQD